MGNQTSGTPVHETLWTGTMGWNSTPLSPIYLIINVSPREAHNMGGKTVMG